VRLSIQAPGCLKLYLGLVEWVHGRGPAPLPELASWPSPLPTTPPRLDNVAVPSAWNNSTNQTSPSPLPKQYLVPHNITNTPDAGQPAPTTRPIPSHSSHTPSFKISDSNTDISISLVKPRLVQGSAIIVLPRIETHVYLDIDIPPQSWNAILLPLTKSVTNDDSSEIGELIKPLLLDIVVRGATTRQEYHSVCEKCEKRIGNKTGPPSLIDFHSSSNILTPKRGMIQVHFTFACYSRHHRKEDEQYVYVAVAQ
jgi:hypothetical protein